MLDAQQKRNNRCAKRLYDWGEASIPEPDRFSFFEALGCDLEIIKNVLLLTGALHGTKTRVRKLAYGVFYGGTRGEERYRSCRHECVVLATETSRPLPLCCLGPYCAGGSVCIRVVVNARKL